MSGWLTTFIYQAANFIVLALALGWFFFKPVRKALEDRRASALRVSEEAAQKLKDAEARSAQVEAREKDAAQAAAALQRQAEDSARKDAEQILAVAHARADQGRQDLEKQLSDLQETQLPRLAATAAAASAEIVRRLLERIEGPELEAALARAACAELASTQGDGLGRVTVISAATLSPAGKDAVRAALGGLTEPAYQVSPDLIAGLRILTNRGLIDATAIGLSHRAEQALTEKLTDRQEQPAQPAPTSEPPLKQAFEQAPVHAVVHAPVQASAQASAQPFVRAILPTAAAVAAPIAAVPDPGANTAAGSSG